METMTIVIDIEAPTVCFEPCSSYADDADAEGLCATCGWPADDHPEELPTAA